MQFNRFCLLFIVVSKFEDTFFQGCSSAILTVCALISKKRLFFGLLIYNNIQVPEYKQI